MTRKGANIIQVDVNVNWVFRMMIVIEGIDNAGKSTLAAQLSQRLGIRVITSPGPQKGSELIRRVERCLEKPHAIFDRHPCVSDVIYSTLRGKRSDIPLSLIEQFYRSRPLFIYCAPNPNGLKGHITKGHDTKEHLDAVERHYSLLTKQYHDWACAYSNAWWRFGDSIEPIVRMCDDFDPIADVDQFMRKFEQHYEGKPRSLPTDLAHFREKFMQEEVQEYFENRLAVDMILGDERTCSESDQGMLMYHLAEQLDAIIDEMYVQIGTGLLQGFNLREAWRRVHAANMKKERVASAAQSTRNSIYDVCKPAGWVRPDHTDLIADHIHRR